jgi:uncharacterized protein with beta-barrel porin domain
LDISYSVFNDVDLNNTIAIENLNIDLGDNGVFVNKELSYANGNLTFKAEGLNPLYGKNLANIYPIYQSLSERPALINPEQYSQSMAILSDAGNLSPEFKAASSDIFLSLYSSVTLKALKLLSFKSISQDLGSNAPSSGSSDSSEDGKKGISLFASLFHNNYSLDNDTGFSGYDGSGTGVTVGASKDISPYASLFMYLGLTKGNTEFNKLTAEIDGNLFYAGLGVLWKTVFSNTLGLNISGILSLGEATNDYKRIVGNTQTFEGSYDQKIYGATIDFALPWEITPTFYLVPELTLQGLFINEDGFSESADNGNFAALTSESVNKNSFIGILSLGFEKHLNIGGNDTKFNLSLGWENRGGDLDKSIKSHFTLDPTLPFDTLARSVPKNALRVEAALETNFTKSMGLSIDYTGRFNSSEKDHLVNARFVYSF